MISLDFIAKKFTLLRCRGGVIVPFIGIKLIDIAYYNYALGLGEGGYTMKNLLKSFTAMLFFTVLLGLIYPFFIMALGYTFANTQAIIGSQT